MMCAQRDWRRRLPALAYPAISAKTRSPLLGRATANAPPCSSCWMSRPDGDLACHPSRGTTFWLCTGRRFAEQISLAACGFTLRVRVTLDGRAARLPSRFVPLRASLRDCQMCAVNGDRVFLLGVKVSMIANSCSSAVSSGTPTSSSIGHV